ncbi:MAG TPA: permease-like cell division protein FtsX [Candidatus Saccharimonadales bacterium]
MARHKKHDGKSFALQRRRRRQWITFMRMIRYGINNFSRNAWLTIAATAVMTITLLIVFMTLAARSTLQTTVDEIRSNVDMSVYLAHDSTQEQTQSVVNDLRKLPSVKKVSYINPEEARADFAKDSKNSDPSLLRILNEATNKFPWIVRINVADINDTRELDKFVKTNENYKTHRDTERDPSFAGDRRDAIKTIGSWVSFADKAGLAASVIFVVISSLIVFNTIRMAIFNRKEEIQMMKLIGADRSFIRGPFVVEAVVYGFIAAVLATGFGLLMLYASREKLMSYKVAIGPTIDFLMTYIGFVLLGMILAGAIIGIISSLLATRKYLKV